METRCVSTDDIYACTAWSFQPKQIACPKMCRTISSARNLSDGKSVYSRRNSFQERISYSNNTYSYTVDCEARQIGLEASECSTSHICRSSAQSTQQSYIGDSRSSIDKVLDLITYSLFPLHWHRQIRTRALAGTFHFPILFRIHLVARLIDERVHTRHPICTSTCAFSGFSVVSTINRIIFSRLLSSLIICGTENQSCFRFTGLNLTIYTELSYILRTLYSCTIRNKFTLPGDTRHCASNAKKKKRK